MFNNNNTERKVLDRILSFKKIKKVRTKPTGKIIKSFSALDAKKLEQAKRIVFSTEKATVKLDKVLRLFK